MKKNKKTDTIILKGGFFKTGRLFDSNEIGRGCGVIQSKKGKGSYKRKNKYNKINEGG